MKSIQAFGFAKNIKLTSKIQVSLQFDCKESADQVLIILNAFSNKWKNAEIFSKTLNEVIIIWEGSKKEFIVLKLQLIYFGADKSKLDFHTECSESFHCLFSEQESKQLTLF